MKILSVSGRITLGTIFLLLVCFTFAPERASSSFENRFPEEIDEVNAWWKASFRKGGVPTVGEVARHHANSPVGLRVLDLILERYATRQQTFLVYTQARSVSPISPNTLIDLWAQAWRVWLCGDLGRKSSSLEDFKKTLDQLSDEQVGTVFLLAEKFPDEITGALEVRALIMRSPQEPFSDEGGLEELARKILSSAPQSSVASVISMTKGEICASNGEYDAAVKHWLHGLPAYPFDDEFSQWLEKLAVALPRTGYQAGEALFTTGKIREEEIRQVAQALTDLNYASELADNAEYESALKILRTLDTMTRAKAKDSEIWHNLVYEIQGRICLLRAETGQMKPDHACLERVRYGPKEEIPHLLEKGLLEFGKAAEFVETVIYLIRQRIGSKEANLELKCWETIANAQQIQQRFRCEGFVQTIQIEARQLDLLQIMVMDTLPSMVTILENMNRQVKQQEENLLRLLSRAERFARSLEYGLWSLRLANELYACYGRLQIRNLPEDLYFNLAKRAPAKAVPELAQQAETMGKYIEAILILNLSRTNFLSDPGSPGDDSTRDSQYRQTRKLLALLISQEEYQKALEIAQQTVASATGAPWAREASQQLAELHLELRNFWDAKSILENLLADSVTSDAAQVDLEKLLTLATYRTGDHEQSLALANKLIEQDILTSREKSELLEIRAYTALLSREYEIAIDDFRFLDKEMKSRMDRNDIDDLMKADAIEAIIEKLDALVTPRTPSE